MLPTPLQLSTIEPEFILIIAAVLWGLAALATGYPHRRFPMEFPFLFAVIAIIAAAIGITEYVPETVDILLTIVGVLLFAGAPIIISIKLYQAYPPIKQQTQR